jgi:hypothetical protein
MWQESDVYVRVLVDEYPFIAGEIIDRCGGDCAPGFKNGEPKRRSLRASNERLDCLASSTAASNTVSATPFGSPNICEERYPDPFEITLRGALLTWTTPTVMVDGHCAHQLCECGECAGLAVA